MRFGVVLPNVSGLANREALLAVSQAAEDLGYTSIWTSDHLLIPPAGVGRLDCFEALATLAFLAARTERVLLGTSVLITPLREPVLLAKQIATIHELSGGRVVLGLGVGWLESEFELLGVEFARRGELTDSIMDTLDRLLSVGPVATAPRAAELVEAFSPSITTPVPVLIGGSSIPALRRAARRAAGWHPVWREPEEMSAAIASIQAQHPRPGFEISLRVDLDPDPERERDAVGLCGPPDTIAAKVRDYERAGVQHLVIDFLNREDHHVPPLTRVLDQLTWFADLMLDNG